MTTRTTSKAALKDGIKHVLEELWDLKEEEPLYKMFTRECLGAKNIQEMLQYFKAYLEDLSCRDKDDTVLYFQKHHAGKVCMMVHYQSHLSENGLLPEDIGTFTFDSITRKDYVSFVNHLDAIALVSSTGDITTTPPENIRLLDNFKVTYS